MNDAESKKSQEQPAVPDDGHSPYVPKFESEWERTKFRNSLLEDLASYMAQTNPEAFLRASLEALEEERKRHPTPYFPGFWDGLKRPRETE